MTELKSNGVNIYNFPTDDQTVAETNNAMNVNTFCWLKSWRDNKSFNLKEILFPAWL